MTIYTNNDYEVLSSSEGKMYRYCEFRSMIFHEILIGKYHIFVNCSFKNCSFSECETCYFYQCIFDGCNFRSSFGGGHKYCNFKNSTGIHQSLACPSEGGFIGWKKCIYQKKGEKDYTCYIVKLLIPADAKRTSGYDTNNGKCRCSRAKVLEIQNMDGTPADIDKCYSYINPRFCYEIGKWAVPINYDDDRGKVCAGGIHFFVDREAAVDYNLF